MNEIYSEKINVLKLKPQKASTRHFTPEKISKSRITQVYFRGIYIYIYIVSIFRRCFGPATMCMYLRPRVAPSVVKRVKGSISEARSCRWPQCNKSAAASMSPRCSIKCQDILSFRGLVVSRPFPHKMGRLYGSQTFVGFGDNRQWA